MSLTYTTGNPSNLTAGATASMNDIQGPFTDIKTWADAKFSASDLTTATLQTLGMTSGGQVGRGKSIIAATESRTNVAYGTLTTPDQVAGVVLPTDGLIFIAYQALWQESVAGASRAAIFIGANQLKVAVGEVAPQTQAAAESGTSIITTDRGLASFPGGLLGTNAVTSGSGADVTTGQVVGLEVHSGAGAYQEIGGVVEPLAGAQSLGGPCCVFAAAGTYTVSVQFKSSSGSVTAKARKLWVWTVGF